MQFVFFPENQFVTSRDKMGKEFLGSVPEAGVDLVVFEIDVVEAAQNLRWRGKEDTPFAPLNVHLEQVYGAQPTEFEKFGESNTRNGYGGSSRSLGDTEEQMTVGRRPEVVHLALSGLASHGEWKTLDPVGKSVGEDMLG
jgi:hypothetical protein